MGNWSSRKGEGQGIKFLRAHVGHAGKECLIWPLSLDTKGYGHFGLNGKLLSAHRWMCEQVRGKPPTSKHQASHSCGNGHIGCVNPEHLSWKTNSGNALDRRKHGTWATNKTGSRTPMTPEKISEIKSLIGHMTVMAIAKNFNISRRTVERVRAGREYKPFSQTPLAIRRRARKSQSLPAAMRKTTMTRKILTCDDFPGGKSCCSSCHEDAEAGYADLCEVETKDFKLFAQVCCRKLDAAKEAAENAYRDVSNGELK